MIKINVQILNDNGDELLDKQLAVETLDDLGLMDTLAYHLINEAKENEVFDSKEDAEFNKEDIN